MGRNSKVNLCINYTYLIERVHLREEETWIKALEQSDQIKLAIT